MNDLRHQSRLLVAALCLCASVVKAQPLPPGAVKGSAAALPLLAPAPKVLSNNNGVRFELRWDASPDTNVLGYRVWRAATNNFSQLARLIQTNKATAVAIGLTPNTTNYVWVTAYDGGALDSPPAGPLRLVAPAMTPPFSHVLTPASWSYQTTGYFGLTNQVQTSPDLTNWTTRLTFIGRGVVTNITRTNSTKEFYRVIAG